VEALDEKTDGGSATEREREGNRKGKSTGCQRGSIKAIIFRSLCGSIDLSARGERRGAREGGEV